MTPALAAICSELEISVIPIPKYRGPMETKAVESMERILRQHGYAHLKMVLMSVVETPNNKRELVAPVIWALSDLILAHPTWAQRAGEWFSALDHISLADIRARAKANRRAAKARDAISTMLFEALRPVFSEEKQGKLI
jgi:hypothetical protein